MYHDPRLHSMLVAKETAHQILDDAIFSSCHISCCPYPCIHCRGKLKFIHLIVLQIDFSFTPLLANEDSDLPSCIYISIYMYICTQTDTTIILIGQNSALWHPIFNDPYNKCYVMNDVFMPVKWWSVMEMQSTLQFPTSLSLVWLTLSAIETGLFENARL